MMHISGCVKRLSVYVLLCLFLLLSQTAWATTAMRIGYVSMPKYMQENENGSYSGYLYGYMEMLNSYVDADFEYVPYSAAVECEKALQRGDIDIYMNVRKDAGSTFAYSKHYITQTENFTNTYFAALPQNRSKLEMLDHAFEKLRHDQPMIREYFYKQALDNTVPLDLTKAERDYLQSKGTIRVLAGNGERPYMYFENGKPKGVIADIWQMFSRDLDIEVEFIECDTYGEALDRFLRGDGDAVAGFNFDPNWAKSYHADMTLPYIRLDYTAIKRDLQPLKHDAVVAALRKFGYTKQFVERQYPPEKILYFDSPEECLRAVSEGKADVTYLKTVAVQYEITNGDFYNLYSDGLTAYSHDLAVALHDNRDPLLLRILNKEIAHYSPSVFDEVMMRHVNDNVYHQTISSIIYHRPRLFISILLGAFAVLAFGIGMYVREHNLVMLKMINREPMTGEHSQHWMRKHIDDMLAKHKAEMRQGRLAVFAVSLQDAYNLRLTHGMENYMHFMMQTKNQLKFKFDWLEADAFDNQLRVILYFAILPPDLSAEQAAEQLAAEDIVFNLGEHALLSKLRVGVRPIARDCTVDGAVILERVYKAHHEAEIRNENVSVYVNEMTGYMEHEKRIASLMHKALREEEFQTHFQPKVDITTGDIVGAEALVRWYSKELGLMSPGTFIPLMERNGFIVALDYYMLERVMRLQMKRYEEGLPVVPVSVNQSAVHFKEHGYLEQMQALVERYHLVPGMVELEITETAFLDVDDSQSSAFVQNAQNIIKGLRNLGFTIALDDFSSGYSSLPILRKLDVDVVKVDCRTLRQAEADKRCYTILQSIIRLAFTLGMNVVVEGVETEAQETMVKDMGATIAQGFKYYKPLPCDEYEKALKKI